MNQRFFTFNDPTVTDRDHFGSSVAVDGNHVLIRASGDDTSGNYVGQAYLFDIRVPEPGTGGDGASGRWLPETSERPFSTGLLTDESLRFGYDKEPGP